ncbi:MAG: Rrf2 family transcriptional regulator, cysteine metabolism repressor [Methanolobus sp.]|jgi:Rrf2 family protein|uniref:Putative transcriptional regulator n=1 Tax=Methanolobus tindarius DSM 2278 TaxID=1090322 RepID=W9E1M2_METTI|nr:MULTISPECIES: RrF2 family transcriptional regulator [Methanolobus]ETA69506.1 putative transcriptional regulator [Methanolobus tindarius DSM 2278]MDI3486876.1 Rrf2 family transcriptional regulator, cysteine metabolism repressor [Methanolobus sp.]MDK2830610.1 Rrf2 family transcriptional regulator, cysteine metabolism repressor [Methanolobus sp.]MDK2940463.1 Rrf2 family transcriptional regulator, cysteine metabolism repressor [Methanolobus sp.]
MKLSTKSEYACLALIDLSENYGSGYIKIEDICHRQDLPRKYIEQLLLSLKRAGYVKSRRGADGGYMLAKEPAQISLAEIVRLMDGALAPVNSVSKYFYECTPLEKNEALIKVFREIRDYIADKMENTTFADLIKE